MYEIITLPFNSITKTFNVDDLNTFCINKKVLSTKIDATGTDPNLAGKLANDAVAVYRYYWNGSDWVERAEYSNRTEEVAGLTANTLGLYDMSGNVWEWCFTTASGSNRVGRGGSWKSYANVLLVGYVMSFDPDDRNDDIGFRVARTR